MTLLVLIDTKSHIYTLYEGRCVLDKVQSNMPLNAEMVETFRVSANALYEEYLDE